MSCFVSCFIGATAGLLVFVSWELTIRVGKCVCITMECDEIIDQILEADGPPAEPTVAPPTVEDGEIGKKRQRLAALAMGGQSKQYIGKVMSADQIEDLPPEEIEKLYARYEVRLGGA